MSAPTLTHGTTTGYSRGCRCDDCRYAKSVSNRAHRERRRLGTVGDRPGPRTMPAPAPAPTPCERLHADAVLDLLDARARVLEKAVARRHPGAAQRRVEVLQLRAALERHGMTR